MATTPLSSGGEHHITPVSTYIKTIISLVILMAATVAASYWVIPDLPLGPITLPGVWSNNLIALGIATAKALLVILFFMGVKYASPLTRLWTVAGFLTLFIMFFILGDYTTRKYEPAPGWTGPEGSALSREMDPLNQTLPSEVDTNVRPRQ
jgi:cytochrome c oxidase subunit 4